MLSIALNQDVLGTGNIVLKSNQPTFVECQLRLAGDVQSPTISGGKWTFDKNKKTATLTGNVSAGWTLDADNNT